MKASLRVVLLASFLIVGLLGVYVIYRVTHPAFEGPPLQEYVTDTSWNSSLFNVEEAASYARIENGVFKLMVYQDSADFFGASLFQQGDNPHGVWNATARLRQEITIQNDREQWLILEFSGRRTSFIDWFSDDPDQRANNIGILLVGDVGLGYYDHDITAPRALFIDIWLDTNPRVPQPLHWQGVPGVENDYHSGYAAQNMSMVGRTYDFDFRIDQYIRDSLSHWGLQSFRLKMVQFYIEGRASSASMDASRVVIRTLS